MKKIYTVLLYAGLMACSPEPACDMTIDTEKPGARVSDTMYGLFFEDINFAADGGLYGELVKNRSFEFPQPFMGWQVFGNVELLSDGPFSRCPHYVMLSDPGHSERRTGLVNEGYFGIGLNKDENYSFSVWAKAPKGQGRIKVQLINEFTGAETQELTAECLDIVSKNWQKYEVSLTSPLTINKAQLRIYLQGAEPVALEHVSLFPAETFKGHGLRRDIAQALADLHPGVLRFPGGCIVEGTDLATRYQWKNSLGPAENRPLNQNRWQTCFDYRLYPDYFQSYGLGFYEFFQFAEDIGAEPLPVMNVGMACQFQNWDNEAAHARLSELQPYIDDCLDLIEFANGSPQTTWGAKRAEMGHPEPFGLKFIAVGNEQWEDFYFSRLKPFVKAIRAKYPEIKIIGSSGPNSEGADYEHGWKAMREIGVDLVDEHFYRNEDWFLGSGLRYEAFPRTGPKVFAGEYACHGKDGHKYNHYETSLYEAAFMTDLERNADLVEMATYAPLLAHVEGWQWRPDLLWFDNTSIVKTTSYYVQQLYSLNKGTNVLTMTMGGQPVAGQSCGLFASSVYDEGTDEVIVKIINTSTEAQSVRVRLDGMSGPRTAKVWELSHENMDDENSISEPSKIQPSSSELKCQVKDNATLISDRLAPRSFRVYRVKRNI